MNRRPGTWLGFVSLSAIAFGSLLASAVAGAQSIEQSPVIFRSGAWDVHRTQDIMNDGSVCTAVYKNQFGIQLSANALTIASPDGVKRVRLRFDAEDPQAQRPATHDEMRYNRIQVDGHEFAELLDSRRLRYEVVTATNDVINGDIDLSGAFQAHDNVAAGCAGNPIDTPKPAASGACTPELRQRMADQGIPPANIDKICSG